MLAGAYARVCAAQGSCRWLPPLRLTLYAGAPPKPRAPGPSSTSWLPSYARASACRLVDARRALLPELAPGNEAALREGPLACGAPSRNCPKPTDLAALRRLCKVTNTSQGCRGSARSPLTSPRCAASAA